MISLKTWFFLYNPLFISSCGLGQLILLFCQVRIKFGLLKMLSPSLDKDFAHHGIKQWPHRHAHLRHLHAWNHTHARHHSSHARHHRTHHISHLPNIHSTLTSTTLPSKGKSTLTTTRHHAAVVINDVDWWWCLRNWACGGGWGSTSTHQSAKHLRVCLR